VELQGNAGLVLDQELFCGWILENDEQRRVVVLGIRSDDDSHYPPIVVAA
jgi:hypothetical protein